MTDIVPGRCYYPKRVGWRWEVWFCHSDSSADPASGATEWKAVTTRFWRWVTAARISNEIWSAFNDGVWIANCRHYDAAFGHSAVKGTLGVGIDSDRSTTVPDLYGSNSMVTGHHEADFFGSRELSFASQERNYETNRRRLESDPG